MNILYRKPTEKDYPYIIDIYNNIIDENKFTADINHVDFNKKKQWFINECKYPYFIFVVEYNNIIIGYFYLSPWRSGRKALIRTGEISFYLKKEYRSKGIGKKLISWAIEEAKKNGFKTLLAILLDINQRSKYLLKNHNFKVEAHLNNIANLNGKVCGQYIMMLNIK